MRSHIAATALLLGLSTAGCSPVDVGSLRPPGPGEGTGASGALDGSDAGDSPVCVPSVPPTEVCNGLDDDCDGMIDGEAADHRCELQYLNTISLCQHGTCIPLKCQSGFQQCDGDPGNGCEPVCACTDSCDADAGI